MGRSGDAGGGRKGPKKAFKKGPSSSSSSSSLSGFSGGLGRGGKLEVKFDPEARKAYLTGFSARKKERRAFGLAMQKVKDRKAKIEERKEARERMNKDLDDREERQKLDRREAGVCGDNDGDDGDEGGGGGGGGSGECSNDDDLGTTQVFEDLATQRMYGGSVTVSVSYSNPFEDNNLGDDQDAEMLKIREGRKSRDTEQLRAGYVGKFMEDLKKDMPSKRKTKATTGAKGFTGKGKHGAQSFIGGNSVKQARKIMGRFAEAGSGAEAKGGKRKKGKGGPKRKQRK